VSPDVSGRSDPHGSNPEAVLEFLSQHRQDTERGTTTNRRTGRRGRKTALLGIAAAIALAGAGILVWRNISNHGAAGTAHITALGKSGAHTSTGASGHTAADKNGSTAAAKTQKTALRGPATEPWNRGLQPWGHPAGRAPSNFYYQWIHGESCAAYASYGCWKLKVVTRHGCPHGVMVVVDQMRRDAVIGPSWGFSRKLAARTSAVVEVDADRTGLSARVDSMICRS
jgi:hypothetical protein